MKKVLFILILTSIGANSQNLPKEWYGYWKGPLNVYAPDKTTGLETTKTYPMAVEIQPIDSVRCMFAIIYGEDTLAGRRPYELIKTTEPGHYILDEKNGIKIDNYLLMNGLYNRFELMEVSISANYQLQPDGTMLFSLITTRNKAISISGGQSEQIPSVNAYKILNVQKATLKKQ